MEVSFYDIRDSAQNKHRQVDDAPFGGGQGMLLMPQPAFDCMEAVLQECKDSTGAWCICPRRGSR